MSKKDEALKLAREALEYISSHYLSLPKIGCMALAAVDEAMANFECWNLDICDEAITAIREALAEPGCDYCNHPQYAGTKCKNCGREQPAQGETK